MPALRLAQWLPETSVAARLCSGATFFLAAVFNRNAAGLETMQLLAALLLLLLVSGRTPVVESLKLLAWLILPILLLHMLFTPGEVLFAVWNMRISREGLLQGAELSMHLVLLYFAGVLFLRMLEHHEWLHAFARVPWLGKLVCEHIVLLQPFYHSAASLTSNYRRATKIYGIRGWRCRVALFSGGFGRMLLQGRLLARQAWVNWGDGDFRTAEAGKRGGWMIHCLWGFGWLLAVALW